LTKKGDPGPPKETAGGEEFRSKRSKRKQGGPEIRERMRGSLICFATKGVIRVPGEAFAANTRGYLWNVG